jgi:hypothetical protein
VNGSGNTSAVKAMEVGVSGGFSKPQIRNKMVIIV